MAGYYGITREFKVTPTVKEIIGRGLSLSPVIGRTHAPQTNGGIDRIVQSVKVILSTKMGSRFFNPSFGSQLHSILFENNVEIKQSRAEMFAREAIEAWEPRVTYVEAQATPDQEKGKLHMIIRFRVIGDNGLHETPFDLVDEGVTNGSGELY